MNLYYKVLGNFQKLLAQKLMKWNTLHLSKSISRIRIGNEKKNFFFSRETNLFQFKSFFF